MGSRYVVEVESRTIYSKNLGEKANMTDALDASKTLVNAIRTGDLYKGYDAEDKMFIEVRVKIVHD